MLPVGCFQGIPLTTFGSLQSQDPLPRSLQSTGGPEELVEPRYLEVELFQGVSLQQMSSTAAFGQGTC